MGYNPRSRGSNYGKNRRAHTGFGGKSIAEVQNERSLKAKIADNSLKAPIASSFEQWAANPNRLDLPNVDTPKEIVETKASSTLDPRAIVKQALDEGRFVPPDLLAQFPDLQPKNQNTPDNVNAIYTDADQEKDKKLKPSSKKPWEMTYKEFFDHAGSEYTAGDRFGLVYHGRVPSYLKEVEGKTIWVGEEGATPEERIHRAVIRQALAKGEKVPENILNEYPDLKPEPIGSISYQSKSKPWNKITIEQQADGKIVKIIKNFEDVKSIELTPAKASENIKDMEYLSKQSAGEVTKSGNLNIKVETKGTIDGASATFNKATGWMAIEFSSIPPPEVRQEMKSNGFRWNPVRKQWVGKWYPYREEIAKKIAGKIEEVNIETNWAAKAEHAAEMAAKHEAKSDALWEQADKMASVIPFGQPILVGHYSEKRDRNFRNRLENKWRKSSEEHKIAESYADKAARFGEKATGESPDKIYRRIQKLEAEKRGLERRLSIGTSGVDTLYHSGTLSLAHQADLRRLIERTDQRLGRERELYTASGGIPTDNLALKPGDRVKTRFGTGTLATISKKTARVKLDSSVGIYTNRRNESLLSVDDIRGKL